MFNALLPFALILLFINPVFADNNKVNPPHLDNDISCADCHGTDTPQKRAPARFCIECHSQVPGLIQQYSDGGFERSINVHDSHDGQLRCTLCHKIHNPSKLYCNDCHEFDVSVP